jgi:hypothetical protein
MTLFGHDHDNNSNDYNNNTNIYHTLVTYNDIKTQISETWDYDDDDKYISHFENATMNNNGITVKIADASASALELQFSYLDESGSNSMFRKTVPIHRRDYSNIVYNALESTISLYQYIKQHQASPIPLVQQDNRKRTSADVHTIPSNETKKGNGKKNKKPKIVQKNTGVNI